MYILISEIIDQKTAWKCYQISRLLIEIWAKLWSVQQNRIV